MDVLTVYEQEVNGDIVRRDSIYMDIEFENQFGEVLMGQCSGKKM